MFPTAIISDPRVEVVGSRLQLINGIGQLLGMHNSSLSYTRSLSDMGGNRRNTYFIYYTSKNKNFNSLMGTLAIKYKGMPI